MDTSKKVRYPLPKTEQEFLFRTRQMKDLLKRTCLNMNENLWSTMVDYDTEFLNPLQGQDGSMDDKLEELKNPTLVYSLMCNFLGRSIVCSRQVFDKYTLTLKKRVKDTMSDVHTEIKSQIENNNTNTTSVSKSVNALDDVLVPILVPYKRANADFAKWSNEPVSWFEYVNEIGLKEAFVSRLRERSVKYDLSESVDFFIDYMAHLHLDNYLYKGLKRGGPSCGFSAERQFKWGFPMNIDIRCVQRKELYGQRRDWIMTKNHEQHKYIRIEYRHVDRDLDPYFHGGHFRAIFSNEINALEYYIKNHMSKQFITEVPNYSLSSQFYFIHLFFIKIMHLLYGIEVQKCPGAAIWTMFIVDLIDGDKISQRSIFYAYDARFPKELGLGGVFPGKNSI